MMLAAKGVLHRLPVLTPRQWMLLAVVLVLLYLVHALHLDNRLYYWIETSHHATDPHGMGLPDYRVRIEARPVAGVADNLSGLTYDGDRDQLWAVANSPEELLALDKDGVLLGRYPLSGFRDVEGVTYLGDNLLLLAEERDHALVVVELPEKPGVLLRENARALTLGIALDGNRGFEGVGYDPRGDRLFVVKEHSPRKLYEVRGLKASLQGQFNLKVIDRDPWINDKDFASDLSSVHYDMRSGHLALLSDESKLLMELDGDSGELISFRSLIGGFAGLKNSVPQGEGMTLDADGNLYLVSEPNLFYRFQRK
nr:SdiA-regulated domain-containing protein [uncultured Pseudomonas sp.]